MREIEIRERKEKAQPISWQLENEIGNFSVVENNDGVVFVEVTNKMGEKFSLNSLLPAEYHITGNVRRGIRSEEQNVFEEEGTYGDIPSKEIVVSERDARREGWQYLLTILHEIGHVDRATKNPGEVTRLLSLYERQPEVWQHKDLLEEVHTLTSRDERDSWAFALMHFRKIVRELGLPSEKIFLDTDSFKSFIRERLLTYKEPALRQGGIVDLSDDERKELLDMLFQLYIREN